MRKNEVIVIALAALALITLNGAGCTKLEQKQPETSIAATCPLSVVVADERHMQNKRKDGSTPLMYEIAPGKGLILDTAVYQFQKVEGEEFIPPDTIMVSVNQKGYTMPLITGETVYTITADTIRPEPTSPPFPDLTKGMQVFIAIGRKLPNAAPGEKTFKPMWGAIAEVH